MKKTLYLRINSSGKYWKARYVKSRKAWRHWHYQPCVDESTGKVYETSPKSFQPWAWISEEDMELRLKYNRVLKNKPTKAMVMKAGWFGKEGTEWAASN